jgi:hypothetical protein
VKVDWEKIAREEESSESCQEVESDAKVVHVKKQSCNEIAKFIMSDASLEAEKKDTESDDDKVVV